MTAWIADLMVGALKLVFRRGHKWYFNRTRGERQHWALRERWWQLKLKADQTKDDLDDDRAGYYQGLGDFHDSPDEKLQKEMMARTGLKNAEPVKPYPAH